MAEPAPVDPQPERADAVEADPEPEFPPEPDAFDRSREPAAESPSAEPDLLERFRGVHAEETERIAREHAERMQRWTETYAAELESLQDDVQAAGDYEATTAVARERTRFERSGALSDYDIVHGPLRLAAVQRHALQRRAELLRMEARETQRMEALYRQHLVDLRAELTRADKLDDAARVDRELRRATTLTHPGQTPFL
jgi:hypothetical protein